MIQTRQQLFKLLKKASNPKKVPKINYSVEIQADEFWIPVKGWEELYQVSNLGRVKSLARITQCADGSSYRKKENILKGSYDQYGEPYFHLSSTELSKDIRVVYSRDMLRDSFINSRIIKKV